MRLRENCGWCGAPVKSCECGARLVNPEKYHYIDGACPECEKLKAMLCDAYDAMSEVYHATPGETPWHKIEAAMSVLNEAGYGEGMML